MTKNSMLRVFNKALIVRFAIVVTLVRFDLFIVSVVLGLSDFCRVSIGHLTVGFMCLNLVLT